MNRVSTLKEGDIRALVNPLYNFLIILEMNGAAQSPRYITGQHARSFTARAMPRLHSQHPQNSTW